MLSRIRRALLALSLCASLVGCGENFHPGDWLWWPSLTPITSAYVDQVPVRDVSLEVQCEIYQFVRDPNNVNVLLDPSKGAGVVLVLQTDLTGSVQYTGIDLSKLGAPSLAELVTLSNKVPSLQAKAQGLATVSAEVDFTVAQSYDVPDGWTKKPQAPRMIIKESDLSDPKTNEPKWENSKFTSVDAAKVDPKDPKTWEMKAEPAQPPSEKAPKASTFQRADCSKRPPYRWYLKMALDDWLRRYSYYGQSYLGEDRLFVCGTKITLKSSFKLLFDVSAGVNAFMTPPIILPISGFNVDASPDYMHSIAVTFALKDSPGNSTYCKKIGAGAQPSTK